MSISTQPPARQASLQRAVSARLNAPLAAELAVPRTGPAEKKQRLGADTLECTAVPQPLSTCCLSQWPGHSNSQPCLPHAGKPPPQGLLPAIASEVASQLQARKSANFNHQLACSVIQPQAKAADAAKLLPEAIVMAEPNHNGKRSQTTTVATIDSRLNRQAASLQAEFDAMAAGTAVIADRAAWVTAARHTAHQIQEAARSKVLKAFKAALRCMDEETLQAHVATYLQLQVSPKQKEADAHSTRSSLQAPQVMSCPRKPRSRRCLRPASAAAQGTARASSLNRPVSAPAERSGWEWGQELPSTTSALLQAVEVAAAAEPRPGDALLPSPPSWKRQHSAARSTTLTANAFQDQADIATSPAVEAASLRILASDAQSCLVDHMTVGSNPVLSNGVSSISVEDTQLAQPVEYGAVRSRAHQSCTMDTSLPHRATMQAQPASIAVAGRPDAPASALQLLAEGLAYSKTAGESKLPSTDAGLLWKQQTVDIAGRRSSSAGVQPSQEGRADCMLPVLQSPFAAVADLPISNQPAPAATAVSLEPISVPVTHMKPKLPGLWPSTEALAAPEPIGQPHLAHASLQALHGQAKSLQQLHARQHHHKERPLSGLSKQGCLTPRLLLSPSCVRSNGEASVLQPLAKAQARALCCGSALQGSSSKKRCRTFMQSSMGEAKHGLKTAQPLPLSELLPGRNVVVAGACVADLAHLLILPLQWCWVARIDKVLATHIRVSWYGKHSGRWTLARHVVGPDQGQVRTGDVNTCDNQILAVFDRFTGNKEVPADVVAFSAAQLTSTMPAAGDQENISVLAAA